MLQIPNDIFFTQVAETLAAGDDVTIPMRGVSMLPLLREGRDSVRLTPVSRRAVRRGDVVLFRHGGRYVLHRYRGLRDGLLHIHGDGLLGRGEYCRREDVVAVMTHVVRRSGVAVSVGSLRWRVLSTLWLLIRVPALHVRNRLGKCKEWVCKQTRDK